MTTGHNDIWAYRGRRRSRRTANHDEESESGRQEAQQKAHGLVAADCSACGDARIPVNTLACPSCGYTRAFDQHQYDMLMRCSRAGEVSEWNEWREMCPDQPILLEGANLEEADLWLANLENADVSSANMEGARLRYASLKHASLAETRLAGACLWQADLEGAELFCTRLQGADLWTANLKGTVLLAADLRGVCAQAAIVDGATLVQECSVDDATDFTGVALASARVDPPIRSHLEYNIRRIGWQTWYERNWLRRRILQWPVRLFWSFSDYGRSTMHIVLWFIALSGLFALIYCHFPHLVRDPDLIGLPLRMRLIRSAYFSIVTMTTLGFGDIHANPSSPLSHIVLSFHALLGYVLLGALITRFAIMFQGGTVPWERQRPRKRKGKAQAPP